MFLNILESLTNLIYKYHSPTVPSRDTILIQVPGVPTEHPSYLCGWRGCSLPCQLEGFRTSERDKVIILKKMQNVEVGTQWKSYQKCPAVMSNGVEQRNHVTRFSVRITSCGCGWRGGLRPFAPRAINRNKLKSGLVALGTFSDRISENWERVCSIFKLITRSSEMSYLWNVTVINKDYNM